MMTCHFQSQRGNPLMRIKVVGSQQDCDRLGVLQEVLGTRRGYLSQASVVSGLFSTRRRQDRDGNDFTPARFSSS